MPKRTTDNPLVLPLMGLLMERPMHPYEMAAVLRERGKDAAVRINRGSLYDVVRAIETAGWITALATVREGGRPARTVYELTPEGRAEFTARLGDQIRRPRREYPAFLTAVAYLGALGPQGALAALREREDRLGELLDAERAALDEALTAAAVPRLHVIEAEYALHQLDGERAWVRAIADEIRAGTLTWPTSPDESENA
ncbi:PadR family transcriptional regulator [Phytomonospora endophytica]|uniref:DNA-binding PadR family transcriptional regulator n=1 Tax=Phytomonospora endophytica TaxID=714109 RepID=A0A841FMN6_9ACTN|nr:PadR family transcriptional regulator [Phytomonospora endophytica]MBB6034812.1 DNA-binding PadR family transcriptional regulator [Phytomonospora endophytica]GIG68984.1 PadR family transcriptional regulator [Phytomonospora endophytica]